MANNKLPEATDEDIVQLLGAPVLEICRSLGKPGSVLASSLVGLSPSEALSALLGYRDLPTEAMRLFSARPANLVALRTKAHEVMAMQRRERALKSLDMTPVLEHFRKELDRLQLPIDLHDALAAYPASREAMTALLNGRGEVPEPIRGAYDKAGHRRPHVLRAAQNTWQRFTSAQA